jgi:hypothetical protein
MGHGPGEENVPQSFLLHHRYDNLNKTGVAAVHASIRPSAVSRAKPFHLEMDTAVPLGSEFYVNADWMSVAKPRFR